MENLKDAVFSIVSETLCLEVEKWENEYNTQFVTFKMEVFNLSLKDIKLIENNAGQIGYSFAFVNFSDILHYTRFTFIKIANDEQ